MTYTGETFIDPETGFNVKTFDNDESCYYLWKVFPRMSQESAESTCKELGLTYYYSGPGRSFMNEPVISHSKSRTLIVQRGGLDI